MVVKEGEEIDIRVYTRGIVGATFSITEQSSKLVLVEDIDVVHGSVDNKDASDLSKMPTAVHITAGGKIVGPKKIKVKGQSSGGVFGRSESFLIVGTVFAR